MLEKLGTAIAAMVAALRQLAGVVISIGETGSRSADHLLEPDFFLGHGVDSKPADSSMCLATETPGMRLPLTEDRGVDEEAEEMEEEEGREFNGVEPHPVDCKPPMGDGS